MATPQEGPLITLKIRKLHLNRLLRRRQFSLGILHPGRENVPKKEIKSQLAKLFRADPTCVIVFGLRTTLGGVTTTGYGLVYDDELSRRQLDKKHRLYRDGLLIKEYEKMPKQNRSHFKNWAKRFRGRERAKQLPKNRRRRIVTDSTLA